MLARTKKYDIFLAHATPDKESAKKLYDLLNRSAEVFLACESLDPGDSWPDEIPHAQKQSLMTVVLVSSRSDQAYYQSEEIAAAIEMARKDPESHRVVPVYLDDPGSQVPYGLRRIQGLYLSELGSLGNIASRLLSTLTKLKFGTLQEQQAAQEADIKAIQISLKAILTKHELGPLKGLREAEYQIRFEPDLYGYLHRLDGLNFIQPNPGFGLISIRQEHEKDLEMAYEKRPLFDLKKYVYITDEGREYLDVLIDVLEKAKKASAKGFH